MRGLTIYRRWISCAIVISILVIGVSPVTAQIPSEYPVYHLSDELEIREISQDVFVATHRFPWGGNSLIVLIGESDAVFVDTPYTPEATEAVLDWIAERSGERHFIEINSGYHLDNLGGNQALINRNIPIIGSDKTVLLLRERGEDTRRLGMSWLEDSKDEKYRERHATIPYVAPTQTFHLEDGYKFSVGDEQVEVIFPGETHAPDNVVVYFPQRKLLFGGCMLHAGNGAGNRADANINTWKSSVEELRKLECDIVIPGHGIRFDPGIIENTISVLP